MTLLIVAITGWLLAIVLSYQWWIILFDWIESEWERRHRPQWPPPGVIDQERKD